MSDYQQIIVEQVDAVLKITLNRPEKLNAYTPTMMGELIRAISTANEDTSIGSIVVTGAGRGFCAGADIEAVFSKNIEQGGEDTGGSSEEARGTDWVQLVRDSKPMIAAINGPAIGVGLTLVLPFDVILAAKGAKLSARFVKMGLVPELASSHFLTLRCGFGAASWLALSGTTVLAEEAKELRLVDRVTEPEALLDEAMAVAEELAGNPPLQLRQIKALLSQNAGETDLAAVQRRELEALQAAYKSPEHKEAVAAFLERRPPRFR